MDLVGLIFFLVQFILFLERGEERERDLYIY